ncbi:MAG TPA: pantoate--beta-alanine ligase [Solirubrobacteraceae bacterium]|nr:pantoate--beta-alanine ligase [Solirubrobacteraceae bacterium]
MRHTTGSQHGCLEVVRTVSGLRAGLGPHREAQRRIALVPTMGALHEGHLSLIRHARAHADVVVVSLFVNPSQFNERADLDSYPRRERRDAELAAQAGADVLFAPAAEEVYPPGFATTVEVLGLTDRLEGEFRGSAHFRGVTTVVTKLLCMAMPDVAYFGQKDAQQVVVIRRLVADLNLAVRVEALPTVREADGLAMSSRNQLLSPDERRRASAIPAALAAAEQAVAAGESAADAIARAASDTLAAAGLEPEYVALVDPETLEPLQSLFASGLLVLAVRVGSVRVIDNATLSRRAVGRLNQSIAGGALA